VVRAELRPSNPHRRSFSPLYAPSAGVGNQSFDSDRVPASADQLVGEPRTYASDSRDLWLPNNSTVPPAALRREPPFLPLFRIAHHADDRGNRAAASALIVSTPSPARCAGDDDFFLARSVDALHTSVVSNFESKPCWRLSRPASLPPRPLGFPAEQIGDHTDRGLPNGRGEFSAARCSQGGGLGGGGLPPATPHLRPTLPALDRVDDDRRADCALRPP